MRIIVTGGGTGGHLFPGIAVARGIQDRFPGCKVMFIGTNREVDRKALAACDFQLATVNCLGIKGKSVFDKLNSILQLPGALLASLKIVKTFKPDIVFGVGGYVTGPVLLAARLSNVPTCIHEQNSIPGLANRIAAKIATKIFISIPGEYDFSAEKTTFTGNPVRSEIIAVATGQAEKRAGKRKNILVLGGSQGAHRVNTLMQEVSEILKRDLGDTFQITHQTGAADVETTREAYRLAGGTATVQPFFDDMARLYKDADLVVSRAGATTLAELSVMGLPAILIPYPFAADNHQTLNGSYYVSNGGAKMFPESDLSGLQLANEISSLLHNPNELRTMATAMKKMAKPEATNSIINHCTRLITPDKHV